MRSPKDYTFTRHAVRKLRERLEIDLDWIDQTIRRPERVEKYFPDEHHYLCRIEGFNGRWLRVVVNPSVNPPAVITAHFDSAVKDD